MRPDILKRVSTLIAGASLAIGAACSGSERAPAQPLGVAASQAGGQTNGGGTDTAATDTTHTPPGPGEMSDGPVDHVVVTPQRPTLPEGYSLGLTAVAFDAHGVRVRNTKAAWRSSDASVAPVSDTGVVLAKQVGIATIFAIVDGHADSSVVTVVGRVSPVPPPLPPPPVASFDLTVLVRGSLPGSDTSHTEVVAGATVTVTQVGGIAGDTLLTSIAAGQANTDASGNATFKNLPGGFYTIDVVPPAGSPYTAARAGLGAPDVKDVHTSVKLARR